MEVGKRSGSLVNVGAGQDKLVEALEIKQLKQMSFAHRILNN